MEKNLYIDASHPDETRIVLKSNSSIEEYEYEDKNKLNFKNNIYLGTVSRVEPSLQAAFINFGRQRHGFLAFNDVQSDYYQIPTDDKEKLQEAEEKIREDLKNTSSEELNNSDVDGNLQKENELDENNLSEINGDNLKTEQEQNNRSGDDVSPSETKNKNASENNKKNYREKLGNTYGLRRYKIQEVIKPGQVLLIQVLK